MKKYEQGDVVVISKGNTLRKGMIVSVFDYHNGNAGYQTAIEGEARCIPFGIENLSNPLGWKIVGSLDTTETGEK